MHLKVQNEYFGCCFNGFVVKLKMCGSLNISAQFIRNQLICMYTIERGSCMVWEINMGVCPRLDFDIFMLFNCLGYNFNIYGEFEFLCNSIADL